MSYGWAPGIFAVVLAVSGCARNAKEILRSPACRTAGLGTGFELPSASVHRVVAAAGQEIGRSTSIRSDGAALPRQASRYRRHLLPSRHRFGLKTDATRAESASWQFRRTRLSVITRRRSRNPASWHFRSQCSRSRSRCLREAGVLCRPRGVRGVHTRGARYLRCACRACDVAPSRCATEGEVRDAGEGIVARERDGGRVGCTTRF